jgi:hypothetical protein
MSIAPIQQPSLLSLIERKGSSNQAPSAASPDPNAPAGGLDNSQNPQDIISQIADGGYAGLLKYKEEQIAKQVRQQMLQQLGLNDSQLKSLPPQQQSAIEQAIEKAIKAALGLPSGSGGGSSNGSASAQASGTAATAQPAGASGNSSLISSSTLNALLGFQ